MRDEVESSLMALPLDPRMMGRCESDSTSSVTFAASHIMQFETLQDASHCCIYHGFQGMPHQVLRIKQSIVSLSAFTDNTISVRVDRATCTILILESCTKQGSLHTVGSKTTSIVHQLAHTVL